MQLVEHSKGDYDWWLLVLYFKLFCDIGGSDPIISEFQNSDPLPMWYTIATPVSSFVWINGMSNHMPGLRAVSTDWCPKFQECSSIKYGLRKLVRFRWHLKQNAVEQTVPHIDDSIYDKPALLTAVDLGWLNLNRFPCKVWLEWRFFPNLNR